MMPSPAAIRLPAPALAAGAGLLAALLLSGCVETAARRAPVSLAALPPANAPHAGAPDAAGRPPLVPPAAAPGSGVPGSSAATWQMPWQISPITGGRRERILEADVPATGPVRGTRAALATVGRPLRAAAGPNRTVGICRATVQGAAQKLGAREVEAVSAGRERRDGRGHYVAPVRFRITYARADRYEVRLSTLTCIVDRRGGIVNAFVTRPPIRRSRLAASPGTRAS
ncbi:hypothetical protein [Methylobacterium sp. A54F]